MEHPQSQTQITISGAAAQAQRGLERRLLGYAVAATAGAGFLSGQPANASIIVTPVNTILRNGSLAIDLNHDGTTDFILGDKDITKACCFYTQILRIAGGGSSGAAVVGGNGEAGALAGGRLIGPGDPFLKVQNFAAALATAFNDSNSFFFVYGQFANTTDRFLGLRFEIGQQTHYGWAEFSFVRAGFNGSIPYITADLLSYAYDTVPNQGLLAGQSAAGPDAAPTATPEPATLGLLALGSLGLGFWRRKGLAHP